jgi:hypothetical protein
MTWVTVPAGRAARSISAAAMPSQAMPAIVVLVTQCRSAVIAQRGKPAMAAQSQRCSRPDSVAPDTRKSQLCARNVGTGP